MTVQINRRPDHVVELSAEVPAAAVQKERQRVTRKVGKNVALPGFRPGKVPPKVVEKRFRSEVEEELKRALIEQLWREAFASDESLQPLSDELKVNESTLSDDGSFRFAGEIEVRPLLELPSLDGVQLSEESVEVADAEVEAEIEQIRERQAQWEPVAEDEAAEDEMLAQIDLTGEVVEAPPAPEGDEPVELPSWTDLSVLIGKGAPFPEVDETLQGMRPGETRTFTRRFPDDTPEEQLRGVTASYTVKLSSLRRQVLPPLDDELVKGMDIEGLDTLDDLRQRVREVVEHRKRQEQHGRWQREVLDYLTADLDPNQLPPTLVQNVLKSELDRYAMQMVYAGQDPRTSDIDWQQVSAQLEPAARRKALDRLALEQMAELLEVTAPEATVDAYIRSEASQQGMSPAELKAKLASEDRLEAIRNAALIEETAKELVRVAREAGEREG
jgi:trigger factor